MILGEIMNDNDNIELEKMIIYIIDLLSNKQLSNIDSEMLSTMDNDIWDLF